jgi:hypothetical protein
MGKYKTLPSVVSMHQLLEAISKNVRSKGFISFYLPLSTQWYCGRKFITMVWKVPSLYQKVSHVRCLLTWDRKGLSQPVEVVNYSPAKRFSKETTDENSINCVMFFSSDLQVSPSLISHPIDTHVTHWGYLMAVLTHSLSTVHLLLPFVQDQLQQYHCRVNVVTIYLQSAYPALNVSV